MGKSLQAWELGTIVSGEFRPAMRTKSRKIRDAFLKRHPDNAALDDWLDAVRDAGDWS